VVAETDAASPLSFYGVSKLTPEYYLRVFHHLFGLRYTVLRYANVYGPRQGAVGEGGVVSIFISRLIGQERPVIFGDGEQTRDFIYVEDVAAANVSALTKGDQAVLNIGTGQRETVNRLWAVLCQVAGTELEPIYTQPREGDIRHSCMDAGQAAVHLGWGPGYSLAAGLKKTIEYYRAVPGML
jgi:UDP-glucose 4-epimerase